MPATSGLVVESSTNARVLSLQASTGTLSVAGPVQASGLVLGSDALYSTAGTTGEVAFDGA